LSRVKKGKDPVVNLHSGNYKRKKRGRAEGVPTQGGCEKKKKISLYAVLARSLRDDGTKRKGPPAGKQCDGGASLTKREKRIWGRREIEQALPHERRALAKPKEKKKKKDLVLSPRVSDQLPGKLTHSSSSEREGQDDLVLHREKRGSL